MAEPFDPFASGEATEGAAEEFEPPVDAWVATDGEPEETPAPPEAEEGGGVLDTLGATGMGAVSGVSMGWDDEIGAAIGATFNKVMGNLQEQGLTWDESYDKLQKGMDEAKAQRREQHPTASMVGEIGGALIPVGHALKIGKGASMLAKGANKLMKGGGVKGDIARGIAAGGVTGAGEAKQGEGLEGAVMGAALGGAAGTVLGTAAKGGKAFLNKFANKTKFNTRDIPMLAEEGKKQAAALKKESFRLFKSVRESGVMINPNKITELNDALDEAVKDIDVSLFPKVAKRLEFVKAQLASDNSVKKFHDTSMWLNEKIVKASKADELGMVKGLGVIKAAMQKARGELRAGDVTGENATRVLSDLTKANKMHGQRKNAELVSGILDDVGIDGKLDKLTINENTSSKFQTLHKRIREGLEPGFSDQEKVLVRKLAEGSDVNGAVRIASKIDPRGRLMVLLGVGAGAGGVGGLLAGITTGLTVGAAVAAAPVLGGLAATKAKKLASGKAGADLLREITGAKAITRGSAGRHAGTAGKIAAQQTLQE